MEKTPKKIIDAAKFVAKSLNIEDKEPLACQFQRRAEIALSEMDDYSNSYDEFGRVLSNLSAFGRVITSVAVPIPYVSYCDADRRSYQPETAYRIRFEDGSSLVTREAYRDGRRVCVAFGAGVHVDWEDSDEVRHSMRGGRPDFAFPEREEWKHPII